MSNLFPSNFLSYTTNGWCLISNGMPLSEYTDKKTVESIAKQKNIPLPNVYWNGLSSKFEKIND